MMRAIICFCLVATASKPGIAQELQGLGDLLNLKRVMPVPSWDARANDRDAEYAIAG